MRTSADMRTEHTHVARLVQSVHAAANPDGLTFKAVHASAGDSESKRVPEVSWPTSNM
jgi:hypothetical protein